MQLGSETPFRTTRALRGMKNMTRQRPRGVPADYYCIILPCILGQPLSTSTGRQASPGPHGHENHRPGGRFAVRPN